MRKIQTTALFLLRFLYWETYILLENIFEETQLILLHSHYRFFPWQVTGNAVTPMPIQIFIGFVHAIPRSKILGNRLGIFTQISAAMDYSFYLFISVKYLQFREKSILIWEINFIIKNIIKGIEILANRLFSFSIIVFSMKLLLIRFIGEKNALAREYFWFTPYN